jgi:hypothetical protein
MLNKFNKKGGIGDIFAWVVATIVIAGLLFFFLVSSSILAKNKKILPADIDLNIGDGSSTLEVKNFLSYTITNNKDRQKIENILEEKNV